MEIIALLAQAKSAGLPMEWISNMVVLYFMLSRPISKVAKAMTAHKEDSDHKFDQIATQTGIKFKPRESR